MSGNTQFSSAVTGCVATGSGNVQVNGPTFNIQNREDEKSKDDQCLRDLRLTNPKDDLTRIESSKGGLLHDAFEWILKDATFTDWRDGDAQLLWIKGDPGKGKTMMMIGLTQELRRKGTLAFFFCQTSDPMLNSAEAILRGLLFLLLSEQRSFIKHLRERYDTSGKHVFEDGNAFYTLSSVLSNIIRDADRGDEKLYLMVDGLDECETGLDKLLSFIDQEVSDSSSKVKWIVSSRNRPEIEECLRSDRSETHKMISLESRSSDISQGLSAYINDKLRYLKQRKGYDSSLQEIATHLRKNAEETFLYVSLVCQELQTIRRSKTRLALKKSFPRGLEALYERMLSQVEEMKDQDDVRSCLKILCAVTLAFRPLALHELIILADLPDDLIGDPDDIRPLKELVDLCGSFISLREGEIRFVHQSARDFLVTSTRSRIYSPLTPIQKHQEIASRCLHTLDKGLRRDLCNLSEPSALIEDIELSTNRCVDRSLSMLRYACCFWADHLEVGNGITGIPIEASTIQRVIGFLEEHFLHWLEALSLLRSLSQAIFTIQKLNSLIEGLSNLPSLVSFLHDARRFILQFRTIIEKAPLQVYYSALMFSPKRSIVRRCFSGQAPSNIDIHTGQDSWNTCIQILEGHTDPIKAISCSPDGRVIASTSLDGTVRLWDVTTGEPFGILSDQYHSDAAKQVPHSALRMGKLVFNSVAFSPDGRILAAASNHGVSLWDPTNGKLQHTFFEEFEGLRIQEIAFSPDGHLLACHLLDQSVRFYNPISMEPRFKFLDVTTLISFSPNGHLFAYGTTNGRVYLWDMLRGLLIETFTYSEVDQGFLPSLLSSHSVERIVFSADCSKLICSWLLSDTGLWDLQHPDPVKSHRTLIGGKAAISVKGIILTADCVELKYHLWDSVDGALLRTIYHGDCGVLSNYPYPVPKMNFSPDGACFAAVTRRSARVWDVESGELRNNLIGHSREITALLFSPQGNTCVSASADYTIRVWDLQDQSQTDTMKVSYPVSRLRFSSDGKLLVASGSSIHALWDTSTKNRRFEFEKQYSPFRAPYEKLVFSPNSKFIATAKPSPNDNSRLDLLTSTIELISSIEGKPKKTLGQPFCQILDIMFSQDGQVLIATHRDGTIGVWNFSEPLINIKDLQNGSVKYDWRILDFDFDLVALSPNGRFLIGSSADGTLKITDTCTATLDGTSSHEGHVTTIIVSADSRYIVTAWEDWAIRLWEVVEAESSLSLKPYGKTLRHAYIVYAIAFSPDGQLLASSSFADRFGRGLVTVWSANSGEPLAAFKFPMFQRPDELSFGENGFYLHTHVETGVLAIEPSTKPHDHQAKSGWTLTHHLGVDGEWIVYKGKKHIWLPPDYRAKCIDVHNGNFLAIGHSSGSVTFVEFSPE